MNAAEHGPLFAMGMFLGMLLFIEIGRRLGVRRLAKNEPKELAGTSAVEAAMFGLMGLLVALTFSGAVSRFDARRQLIITEANNIGTAYLRIDMLPAAAQPAMRELFRQYLDSRLETYRKLPDIKAAKKVLEHSSKLQDEIWSSAIVACQESSSSPASILVLQALNQMIDITTTRTQVTLVHTPWIVFAMLGAVSLASSLLAGYGMAESRSRSWLHAFAFAMTVSLTFYVIIDIEHPRLGLFRIEDSDQVLTELRQKMN